MVTIGMLHCSFAQIRLDVEGVRPPRYSALLSSTRSAPFCQAVFTSSKLPQQISNNPFKIIPLNLYLRGPPGEIPYLGGQSVIEFRFVADHEDAALVFLQGTFQLVLGIDIQVVRRLI